MPCSGLLTSTSWAFQHAHKSIELQYEHLNHELFVMFHTMAFLKGSGTLVSLGKSFVQNSNAQYVMNLRTLEFTTQSHEKRFKQNRNVYVIFIQE